MGEFSSYLICIAPRSRSGQLDTVHTKKHSLVTSCSSILLFLLHGHPLARSDVSYLIISRCSVETTCLSSSTP